MGDESDTATDDADVCSQCGRGPFKNIFLHWANQHTDCDRPAPDTYEQSLIVGLWLSNADVQTRKDGASYPTLVKYSTNRELLQWCADELGLWVKDNKVLEIRSAEAQQESLEAEFGDNGWETDAMCAVRVRPSPLLADLAGRDIADATLTATAARLLYAFRGRPERRGYGLVFNHPAPEGLAALFTRNGFEATSASDESNDIHRVFVRSEDARRFADWIGADTRLPGCTEKFEGLAALVE